MPPVTSLARCFRAGCIGEEGRPTCGARPWRVFLVKQPATAASAMAEMNLIPDPWLRVLPYDLNPPYSRYWPHAALRVA